MHKTQALLFAAAFILIISLVYIFYLPLILKEMKMETFEGNISLPQPKYSSAVSVEEAILKRRSVREYAEGNLTPEEISQILWSAQGITDEAKGFRAAPSAGALYPLEIYLVTRDGIFHYKPDAHALTQTYRGDIRKSLAQAAVGQEWVEEAPATLVITAIFERTTWKYGERGIKYVYMEAGHAAQNVYLQSVSLGLGSVVIGAFYDEEVQKLLNLSSEYKPVYMMSIGRRR